MPAGCTKGLEWPTVYTQAGAVEMAQWVKVVVNRLDDLSLSPGIYLVEGENGPLT